MRVRPKVFYFSCTHLVFVCNTGTCHAL